MSVVFVPVPGSSSYTATGVAAVNFDVLTSTYFYEIRVSAACLVKQGRAADTPVASAADGATLVTPDRPLLINGANGDTVSIIRVTADGVATCSRLQRIIG